MNNQLYQYDPADAAWIEDVGEKIDEAITISQQTPPIDGETFINKILERFQQNRKDESPCYQ